MRKVTNLSVKVATCALWIVALFYAYGAFVHILNILSLTGFNWTEAPVKWQILDLTYLGLDVVVAAGFILAWKIAYIAFYAAAISQICLYTIFRNWIIDVPEEFAVTAEHTSYLDTLVIFHVITIICVSIALYLTHNKRMQSDLQKAMILPP